MQKNVWTQKAPIKICRDIEYTGCFFENVVGTIYSKNLFVNSMDLSSHYVLCIEGMTGVGKTTLAKKLEEEGFPVVYADEIIFSLLHLPPTQRQVQWILKWFSVVAERLQTTSTSRERPLIVDRSPFAGAMYWPESGRPQLAIHLIGEILKENKLRPYIVCMKQRRKVLLKRIKRRASEQQAERKDAAEHDCRESLNEFDESWFDAVLQRFNNEYSHLWHSHIRLKDTKHLLRVFQSGFLSPFDFELKLPRSDNKLPQTYYNLPMLHGKKEDMEVIYSIGQLHPVLHEIFKGQTYNIPAVDANAKITWTMPSN